MYDNNEQVDDFLQHFGVMGMKWGKHKTSSLDGLTLKKEKKKSGLVEKKSSKEEPSEDHKIAKGLAAKKTQMMSNAEIRTLIQRQQLEKQHKQSNPKLVAKGSAFAKKIISGAGTVSALYGVTQTPVAKKVGTVVTSQVKKQVEKKIIAQVAKSVVR